MPAGAATTAGATAAASAEDDGDDDDGAEVDGAEVDVTGAAAPERRPQISQPAITPITSPATK
ncbi:hypothetical protein GCM10009531_60000 [Actinoplanes capillaceus]